MGRKRVLVVSWHPGAANAVAPVIKKLRAEDKVEVVVIGHEFSKPIFAKNGIAFKAIKDFGLSDVSLESMAKLLEKVSPDLVLTGTSSQEGKNIDVIEQTVTLAAKNSGVKSVAVLDYWIGRENYPILFSDGRTGERFKYLPDYFCVLDEIAKAEILADGLLQTELVITGNPHFDNLAEKADNFSDVQRREIKKKVGLTCKTLFFYAGNIFSSEKEKYGFWDLDVISLIAKILPKMPGVGLVVRLHPRMPEPDKAQIKEFIEKSQCGIKLVDSIDSQTLALAADLTIVVNSTIGIEAVYMRRPCMSFQPGLKTADVLLVSKNKLIPVGYDAKTCEELLVKAADTGFRANIIEQCSGFATDGKATNRVVQLVYLLLSSSERKVSMTITDLQGLSEKEMFAAIQKAHRSFSSLLPGLETLGPGLRAAVAKAKLNPAYKDVSDEEWQQIGMDLSDPRCYYLAGYGHIAPPDSKLEEYVMESADSLLREKHR